MKVLNTIHNVVMVFRLAWGMSRQGRNDVYLSRCEQDNASVELIVPPNNLSRNSRNATVN